MNASHADIITVKQDGTGDFTSIQQGVDASADGDTILVWPGTYFENVVLPPNRAVTLASLFLTTGEKSFINSTIIDGNNSNPCIKLFPGPESFTSIYGFTCMNGKGYGSTMIGGGIYIKNAKAIISDCIITDNWALGAGGVFVRDSDLFLSGSVIKNNIAILTGGGGLAFNGANIQFDTINKNSIFLNYACRGSDIVKPGDDPPIEIKLDTFTVFNPDAHYVLSADIYGYPVYDIDLEIDHAKVTSVNSDLYVAPWGDDLNSGLSASEPLRSVSFAFKKVVSDSLHPNTIYLAPGVYSPSLTGEKFPLSLRSYVSLAGEDSSNTILDAGGLSSFAYGPNTTTDYSIRNLTLRNGFGNTFWAGDDGGIETMVNFNSVFENLRFTNITGREGTGLNISFDKYALIRNIRVDNCLGMCGLAVYNGQPGSNIDSTVYYIENVLIDNGKYDPAYQDNGGGVFLGGVSHKPGKEKGYISNLQVTRCTQTHDPLWPDGGGTISLSRWAEIHSTNITLGHNSHTGTDAGALALNDSSLMDVYNSIIYGNEQHQVYLGYYDSPVNNKSSTLNVAYSDIEDGYDGIVNCFSMNTVNWMEGNIDADPLWDTAAAIPYAIPFGSPCVNAGTPMYEPGMLPPYIFDNGSSYKLITHQYDTINIPHTDLAGNPRIAYGRIDMGAYEFPDTTVNTPLVPWQDGKFIKVFPNPFEHNAFISFSTNTQGTVSVVVRDLSGRKVKSLLETRSVPGNFSITWDGSDDLGFDAGPGTYIATVEVNGILRGSCKAVKK